MELALTNDKLSLNAMETDITIDLIDFMFDVGYEFTELNRDETLLAAAATYYAKFQSYDDPGLVPHCYFFGVAEVNLMKEISKLQAAIGRNGGIDSDYDLPFRLLKTAEYRYYQIDWHGGNGNHD